MPSLSTSDIRWLRHALVQAEQAPHARWRVGAVLIRGGSVLSTGYNRYRNDPAQVEFGNASYHAEEVALRKAGDAEGSTIYVARITRSGALGLAKPCPRCLDLLITEGVSTVVWSTPSGLDKARVNRLVDWPYVGQIA